MLRTIQILGVMCGVCLLGACEKKATITASSGPAWLLDAEPADAVDIGSAKASLAEGQTVALRGRIGGRVDAMSTDSAVFVMMDPAIQHCIEDGCLTPWDYCCTPAETITANNATVQLVDDAGAPLEIDLTTHGVKPLDVVVVVGTVGARPTPDVLVVKATRMYRAQ